MAKISRADTTGPDVTAATLWTSELVGCKDQQKVLKSRQDDLTKRLKAYVQENGYTDDQGHVWVDFPSPVSGAVALQMQRKVSQPLNEAKAEAILEKHDLLERCTKTITVLDEEAIMAAHYAGDITESEIDAMFPKTVNYALLTPKSK